MHRGAGSPSSTYVGSSTGGRVHAYDGAHVVSDGFALTTFLPGVEFDYSEPPDARGQDYEELRRM
jgi:hypothetical protein